jgi:CBS-domain-containing membrane protein
MLLTSALIRLRWMETKRATLSIESPETQRHHKVAAGRLDSQTAAKMRSLDVGALPVCDGRRLVGMITDRDITIRATAVGREPRTTVVRDCLNSEPVYGSKTRTLRMHKF